MNRFAFLSDLLGSLFVRGEATGEGSDDRPLADVCRDILGEHGDHTLQELADTLLHRYALADAEGKRQFFRLLARDYDIDADKVLAAARSYAEESSLAKLAELRAVVEPPRQELIRLLNRAPLATTRLVRMRADLLELCADDPEMQRIDLDFQHLFRSWFNRGFLVLKEIDWRTPANILEKIIAYEAVHEISSWGALRERLEPPDRRCFAYFHPAMVDEPLIFVEVALTRTAPLTIRDVLASDRERVPAEQAETAVFYSISNCQPGLRGVSFGNSLIKHVVSELSAQLPNLTTFRTLSPLPGLMRWVDSVLAARDKSEVIEPRERRAAAPLEALLPSMRLARRIANSDRNLISNEQRQELKRLVAYYLSSVRRPNGSPDDPVARFHLGNGASLDQILPAADVYKKGLSQSASVMVSYLYDMQTIDENHERFVSEQRVPMAPAIAALIDA